MDESDRHAVPRMTHPRQKGRGVLPTPRQKWAILVTGAYLFHRVGYEIALYQEFVWFQILSHAFSAAAMYVILRDIVGVRRALVFAAIGMSAWEIIEWSPMFPRLVWYGPADTALDIVVNWMAIWIAHRRPWVILSPSMRTDP